MSLKLVAKILALADTVNVLGYQIIELKEKVLVLENELASTQEALSSESKIRCDNDNALSVTINGIMFIR